MSQEFNKSEAQAAQNANGKIEFLLCKLCVIPEGSAKPTVVLSNEVLEVQKTYEFREAIAKAACLVANDEESRQVASYEDDRFIHYVHYTPTVKYGTIKIYKIV